MVEVAPKARVGELLNQCTCEALYLGVNSLPITADNYTSDSMIPGIARTLSECEAGKT